MGVMTLSGGQNSYGSWNLKEEHSYISDLTISGSLNLTHSTTMQLKQDITITSFK